MLRAVVGSYLLDFLKFDAAARVEAFPYLNNSSTAFKFYTTFNIECIMLFILNLIYICIFMYIYLDLLFYVIVLLYFNSSLRYIS